MYQCYEWEREREFQSLKGMNHNFCKCTGLVDPLLPLHMLSLPCIGICKSDLRPMCANTAHKWACVFDANVYGKAITFMNNSLIIITVITIVIMDDCGQTWTIQSYRTWNRARTLFHLWIDWRMQKKNSFRSRFKWQECDFAGLLGLSWTMAW